MARLGCAGRRELDHDDSGRVEAGSTGSTPRPLRARPGRIPYRPRAAKIPRGPAVGIHQGGAAVAGGRPQCSAAVRLTSETIRGDVEGSLRRLGTERLDLLQLHWPATDGTPIEEYWSVLADLRTEGKIHAAGLSNHWVEQLRPRSGSPRSTVRSCLSRSSSPRRPAWRRAGASAWRRVPGLQPAAVRLLSGRMSRERIAELPAETGAGTRSSPASGLRPTCGPASGSPGPRPKGVSALGPGDRLGAGVPGVTAAIVGARGPDQPPEWLAALDYDLPATKLAAGQAGSHYRRGAHHREQAGIRAGAMMANWTGASLDGPGGIVATREALGRLGCRPGSGGAADLSGAFSRPGPVADRDPLGGGSFAFRAAGRGGASHVPVHRISQGSGIMMLTGTELDEMVEIGRSPGYKSRSSSARAPPGTSACRPPRVPAGSWRARCAARTSSSTRSRTSAGPASAGCAGCSSPTSGCCGCCQAPRERRPPEDLRLKVSISLPIANPATARHVEDLGADSINLPVDVSLSQIAGIRAAVTVLLTSTWKRRTISAGPSVTTRQPNWSGWPRRCT